MPKCFYFSVLLFFIFCIQAERLHGQNYNFSQFYNSSARLNPSLPSLEQEMAVRLNHRMQSIGSMKAIQSSVLSAYYPWLASKGKGPTSTLGIMVHNDIIAPVNGLSFFSVGVPMSFAVAVNKWERLSFGLMPVYNAHQMNHNGLSTISQYSNERGYNPSLPLNEPLLDARASYVSWNAGLSWNRKNKRGELLSAAGFSASNINQPHEQFFNHQSPIPLAFQAFFTSSLYHDRLIRFMPELFFSSYGPHYQCQAGANMNYNLRYTSLRQGSLNISSRYNWKKSVIVSTQLEQPRYAVGFSVDLYTNKDLPFTQAFEISLALKQGVVGRFRKFDLWPFGKKSKSKIYLRHKRRKDAEDDLVRFPEQQRKGLIALSEGKALEVPVIQVEVKQRTAKGEILFNADESIIQFATASSRLRESALPPIHSIASYLLDNPDYKILIIGHTDNIGEAELNKKLSKERARSVADVLLEAGVAPEAIRTDGAGMNRPLVPNTSAESRAMNRRVEFLIYKD